MANKKILALNSSVNTEEVCFVSDLEARQLVKQNKAYWDILDIDIPKERVLVFSSPDAFYKKKGLKIPMIKTNYELDDLYAPFQYRITIKAPINATHMDNLIDYMVGKYNLDKIKDYKLCFEQIRIVKAVYSDDSIKYLDIKPNIEDGKCKFELDNGDYEFEVLENGTIFTKSENVSSTNHYVRAFTYNFNVVNVNDIGQESCGTLTSSGPWAEPEKVKSIRETIEAVMKNNNTTDIREIDLDMLSSCINATINREKTYFKWLKEFTSDEVDEKTARFAFKFLDWVIQNKIDYSMMAGDMYFKK